METLEVHSKDFLVKWINAPENSIIDWQAKPLKKSINFAIYKKNEQSSVLPPPAPKFLGDDTPSLNAGNNSAPPTNGSAEPDSSTFVNGGGRNRSNSNSVGANTANSRLRSASVVSVNELSESVSTIYKTLSRSNTRTSAFTSNLNNSDLTLVKDYKKLVSGELVHGKFHVKQGGIYAFIFDNSFSKSFGKKILFSTKIIQTRPESNGGSIQSVAVIEPSTASVVTNVPVPNNKSGSGSGSSTASASASVDPLDSSSLPNSGSVTPLLLSNNLQRT